MERLIKIKEASMLTGYSPAGLRLFVKKGRLKVYRTSPKSDLRFKISDLERFLQSGSNKKRPAKKGSKGKPARV